jgi:hypothetical protein
MAMPHRLDEGARPMQPQPVAASGEQARRQAPPRRV